MSNALGVFWYIPGEQETPMLIRTFQVDEVEDAREYATAHKDCDEHRNWELPAGAFGESTGPT